MENSAKTVFAAKERTGLSSKYGKENPRIGSFADEISQFGVKVTKYKISEHDGISFLKDVVASLVSIESDQTGEMAWNDVVDLASIGLPNYFIDGGKSNADVVHEEDLHGDVPIETCLVDDDTIATENL